MLVPQRTNLTHGTARKHDGRCVSNASMRRCVPNATFEKPNARLKNDEKVEHTISQLRRMLKTALLVEHVKKVHWRTSAVTRCLTTQKWQRRPVALTC